MEDIPGLSKSLSVALIDAIKTLSESGYGQIGLVVSKGQVTQVLLTLSIRSGDFVVKDDDQVITMRQDRKTTRGLRLKNK